MGLRNGWRDEDSETMLTVYNDGTAENNLKLEVLLSTPHNKTV